MVRGGRFVKRNHKVEIDLDVVGLAVPGGVREGREQGLRAEVLGWLDK